VLIAAALILMQARNDSDRRVGDTLLATGLVPLVVAAAALAATASFRPGRAS
jgi:hypothetical protein